MTIARRRIGPFGVVGPSMPAAPEAPIGPVAGGACRVIGIPIAAHDVPAPESIAPVGRLRRCTFRRIDRLESLPGRSVSPVYEIMCLYRGMATPMALGDVDSAGPICGACTATGIFRPDEA